MRFIRLAHGRRLFKGTWVLAGWLACSSHVLPLRYWPGNNQFQGEEDPLITCVGAGDRDEASRLSSSILCRFDGAFLVSARDSSLTVTSRWAERSAHVLGEMTVIVGVRRRKKRKAATPWDGFMMWLKAKRPRIKTCKNLKRNIKRCRVPSSRFVFRCWERRIKTSLLQRVLPEHDCL